MSVKIIAEKIVNEERKASEKVKEAEEKANKILEDANKRAEEILDENKINEEINRRLKEIEDKVRKDAENIYKEYIKRAKKIREIPDTKLRLIAKEIAKEVLSVE